MPNYVEIDLGKLNTLTPGYTPPTETGYIVGNITEYGNNVTVNSSTTCNAVAQLIQEASCKTANSCAASGGTSNTDPFGNYSYTGSTSTAIQNIYADYDGTSCKVIITDGTTGNQNCSTVNSEISTNSFNQHYCALDKNNATGGRTDCPSDNYILQDDGVGTGNNLNVSSSVSTGGSVTVTGTAQCVFDAYKYYDGPLYTFVLQDSSQCSSNDDGTGSAIVQYPNFPSQTFRDIFIYWMNNSYSKGPNANSALSKSNTAATFIPASGTDNAHCHFVIDGYDCNHISLNSVCPNNNICIYFEDSSDTAITPTSGSTTIPGTLTKSGCLVGNITSTSVGPVNNQTTCNAAASLIQNSSCKTGNICTANGTSSIDVNGNVSITGSTNTAIQNIYADWDSGSSACKVLISDGTCSVVNSNISTNSYQGNYCGLDSGNRTGGRTDCPTVDYLLQSTGASNGNDVDITASNSTNGSITIGSNIPGESQGITFSCGSNNSINYDYKGFNAGLTNSCSNTDQSFLIFTPKSTTTGSQSLGGGVNSDGSMNGPFNINNVNNQNGQFYLNGLCDVDNDNKDILVSVLDDVIIGEEK